MEEYYKKLKNSDFLDLEASDDDVEEISNEWPPREFPYNLTMIYLRELTFNNVKGLQPNM